MRRFFLIAAAAMPAAAFSGPPEAPDLLIPLAEAEAIEVRQDNRSWLDEHLKHAKRHRLVRVDADVLLSGATFRIALFDGRSMLLEPTERERHGSASEPYRFEWTGRAADLSFSAEDLLAMNPHIGSLEAAKMIYGTLFRISFSGSRYLKDLATGGSWPVPHDHYGDDCRCPAPKPEPGTAPFYAVRGDLSDPRYPAGYRLRPIERDPEYHVLIEIDPASYRQSNVKL